MENKAEEILWQRIFLSQSICDLRDAYNSLMSNVDPLNIVVFDNNLIEREMQEEASKEWKRVTRLKLL